MTPPIVPERGVPLTAETVVVPVEPTEAMIERATENLISQYDANASWDDAKDVIERLDTAAIFRAMTSAAPAREPESGAVERVAKWHEERAAFLTSKSADDEWAETEAQLHRDMAAALTPKEATADHHERNPSMTNDELIEQAMSHPPLEAPAATGAGEDDAAKLLWNRFAVSHHESWDEEPSKAEYRLAAADVLALRAQPQAREEGGALTKCDQCNGDGYAYPNGIGDGHNLQEICPLCGGKALIDAFEQAVIQRFQAVPSKVLAGTLSRVEQEYVGAREAIAAIIRGWICETTEPGRLGCADEILQHLRAQLSTQGEAQCARPST